MLPCDYYRRWRVFRPIESLDSPYTDSYSSRLLSLTISRPSCNVAMWVSMCACVYRHNDAHRSSKARFPLPELTAWVDGWPVSITRQHWPCWRVMETGHPSTRVVETGLKSAFWSNMSSDEAKYTNTTSHSPFLSLRGTKSASLFFWIGTLLLDQSYAVIVCLPCMQALQRIWWAVEQVQPNTERFKHWYTIVYQCLNRSVLGWTPVLLNRSPNTLQGLHACEAHDKGVTLI